MEAITAHVGEIGKAALVKRVTRLAKRAEKLGLPAPTVAFAPADDVIRTDNLGRKTYLSTYAATVECPGEVVIGGYHIVGAIDHDGANIVTAAPGRTMAPHWRTAGPDCDHCGQNRARKRTTILEREGAEIQVGSSCLADFLDSTTAADVVAWWSDLFIIADDLGFSESDECEGGGGTVGYDVAEILAAAAYVIRVAGWVSKGQAADDWTKTATAEIVRNILDRTRGGREFLADNGEITEADKAAGEAAAQWWAESTDDSDYAYNVRAILTRGWVTARHLGIAVSAVPTAQRAMQRAVESAERAARGAASVHVGTVGKRQSFGPCVVTGKSTHENPYGITTRLSFLDESGNVLVWWASGSRDEDVGETYNVTASVKKHDNYNGTAQTVITRAKLV